MIFWRLRCLNVLPSFIPFKCISRKKFSQALATHIPKTEEFQAIYRFKYIRLISALSRIKLFQTFVTVSVIPAASYYMHLKGLSTINEVYASNTLAVLSLALLYALSGYSRRFAGIVYLSKCGNYVRISHLTFWGNRRNVVFEASRVIPRQLNDPSTVIHKLSIEGSPEFFYYSNKSPYAVIYDEEKCVELFNRRF